MNNLNSNHNKFNSTLGFNETKIGRIFEIESFANDFNNKLKSRNKQNLVKIYIIFFRKMKKQNLI
jgi:hypothetical protein